MGGYDGVETGVLPLGGSSLVIEALRLVLSTEGLSLARRTGPNVYSPPRPGPSFLIHP